MDEPLSLPQSQQPPIYTPSPSSSVLIAPPDLVLLNLAPLHNSLTYQSGHLGLSENPVASLVGEVQVKWTGGEEVERPLFSELEVEFRGVEKVEGGEEIELCSQRIVLWGNGVPSSSSNSEQFPGSTTPFKLELTRDLPHCLHFPTSSLEYTLTAKLSYANPAIPPILKSTPIHLVRSSPPGSLLSSLDFSSTGSSSNPSSSSSPPSTTPQTMHITNPLKASVRFGRTVYRRSEVIDIVVRVEIPDQKLVRDERVRLRTIQAELIRKVTTVSTGQVKPNADEATNRVESVATQEGSSAIRNNESRTILAKSGKSCRFSPTRPIVIRLLLHPSLANTCESITQSTILHTISFEAIVTIGLISNGSRKDVTVCRTIFIIPDSPASSTRDEKQRQVMIESESSLRASIGGMVDGPVPAYYENSSEAQYEGEGEEQDQEFATTGGSGIPSSSTFASTSNHSNRGDSWDPSSSTIEIGPEAEYDGYEELSLSLSNRIPPPRIDEDVSPPSPPPFPTSSLSLNYLEPDGGHAEEGMGVVFPPPSFADITAVGGESASSSEQTSGASSESGTVPSSPCFISTHQAATSISVQFDSSPLGDPTHPHPEERNQSTPERSEDPELEPPPYFGLPSPPLLSPSLSPPAVSSLPAHLHEGEEEVGIEIPPALLQGGAGATGSFNGPPPYTNLGEGMQVVGVTRRGELLRLLD